MPIRALPYQASPLALFDRLVDWSWPVLLDSQDAGRWDILSAEPDATVVLHGDGRWQVQGLATAHFADAFAALQAMHVAADAPAGVELPFSGGVIATLGYAARGELGLPSRRQDDWPCAFLARYRWAICSDHDHRQTWLVWQDTIAPDLLARLLQLADALPQATARARPEQAFRLLAPFTPHTSTDRYASDIARIHDFIRAGDCYQINYTQAWSAPCDGSGWAAWPALRAAASAPYSVYWRLPWGELLSVSPEQFLQVQPRPDGSSRVLTRPIKGTRRRDHDAVQDAAEAQALRDSAKDRAENVMITDLLRNDLGKHAVVGSVQVPELCALHSYGQVHHLVSTIEARLAPGHSPAMLFRDAFPGGSITGAPKRRAMEIIEDLEVTPRGIYCGSVILADSAGRWDSSITIRSFVIRDGEIRTWAGGGITLDSVWEEEYQECRNKIGGLMQLLESL